MFFVYIVSVAALLVGFSYSALLAVRQMAENDFIFTMVAERTAKAVVASRGGGLVKMLLQFKGHHLNSTSEIEKGVDESMSGLDSWISFLGLTGVKYLGIPGMHVVYTYPFVESHLMPATESGAKNQIQIKVDQKILDHLSLKDDVYFVPLQAVETIEKLPLDIGLLVTVVPCNPEKALFAVDKWLETLSTQIMSSFRRLVGVLEWDTVQKALGHEFLTEGEGHMEELVNRITRYISGDDKDKRKADVTEVIKALNDLSVEMRKNYGIKVKKLQVGPIDPAGERAKELAAAGSKQYEADQEAKRIATVYGAIEEKGETGRLVVFTEALRDISKNPASTILPFPVEITQLLGSLSKSQSNRSSS